MPLPSDRNWYIPQPQPPRAHHPSAPARLRAGGADCLGVLDNDGKSFQVSTTAADYPIGDGKVLAVRPDGAGTHSGSGNFQDDDSSAIDANSYTRLDEQPFAGGDYVKQTANSNTSYLEFTYANTAESCINGVSGLLAWASQNTTGNNGKASVFNGATENITFSGSMNNNVLQYASAIVAPAGASWSQAELNALKSRVGYSSDASPNPYWHALMLEYDVGV